MSGASMDHLPRQLPVVQDVGDLVSFFEMVAADSPLYVRRMVKAHLAIFRQLEEPEFGIHLLDDVFGYIEESFRYATDISSKEWVKQQAGDVVRMLISFQHAFILGVHKGDEDMARELLREGVEIALESFQAMPSGWKKVTATLALSVGRRGFLEKIFLFFSRRKRYVRRRAQLVWVFRRMLEKIERERHLFAPTYTFAEAIRTAVALLEKYEKEIWAEGGGHLPGRRVLWKVEEVLSRILVWGAAGLLILGFSSLCLLLLSSKTASELWRWLKIGGGILLGAGILKIILSAFGMEALRLLREFNFWRFKRRMLQVASEVEMVARERH